MEFRTWGEYLQWLQEAQLPLFTKALGLAREVSAGSERKKQQDQAETIDPATVLGTCDDSLSRSEAQVAQLREECQETLQMSAEFDQLTAQSRARTNLLQSHAIHAEYQAVLNEGKLLAQQMGEMDAQLAMLETHTQAAVAQRDQLRTAVKIRRALVEQEEAEHQVRLAAAKQRLARAESQRKGYVSALEATNARVSALREEEKRIAREEKEAQTERARLLEEVAKKERELAEAQSEKAAIEAKVMESERAADDSARRNLNLVVKIAEVNDAAIRRKEDVQRLLGQMALQLTSVEEVSFRKNRLKVDFIKRLKEQERRLYAKKVIQKWQLNAADFKEVRQHRAAHQAEEERWLQQQKDELEAQDKAKKPKAKPKKSKTRKKEGAKVPPKQMLESITMTDLCSSFNKMEK